MNSEFVIVMMTAVFFGVGCAQQKVTGVPETVPRVEIIQTVETDADRLLNYYAYMAELQGDTLMREYQHVKRSFDEEPDDFNRMQLVMLLSSQSATFRDTASANFLLETWLGNQYNASSKLRPLALLFDNYLAEVRRMDEAMTREAGKLAESADIITRQAQELTDEREKLRDERRQTRALQKKLDALLEMEMNLIEREPISNPDTK